jgi:hypothetical protein
MTLNVSSECEGHFRLNAATLEGLSFRHGYNAERIGDIREFGSPPLLFSASGSRERSAELRLKRTVVADPALFVSVPYCPDMDLIALLSRRFI